MRYFASAITAGMLLGLSPTSSFGASPPPGGVAWVSKQIGNDAAGCGAIATPCKTFQFAHDNLGWGGTIMVRDAGGYGPLTITKSISVINESGVPAGIFSGANGSAISISALNGLNVIIKGLVLDGSGAVYSGIKADSNGTLEIIGCTIKRFANNGIGVAPMGVASMKTKIIDTVITLNGGAGLHVYGLDTQGTISVNVQDSSFTNNTTGIFAISQKNSYNAVLNLNRTSVNFNSYGIDTRDTASVRLSSSSIIDNTTSDVSSYNNGAVLSYGDNVIGTVSGAIVPLTKK